MVTYKMHARDHAVIIQRLSRERARAQSDRIEKSPIAKVDLDVPNRDSRCLDSVVSLLENLKSAFSSQPSLCRLNY